MSPTDVIDDAPCASRSPGRGNWCPDNYDRSFKGPITLTQALAESRNIPAVELSELVGARERAQHRRGFGIEGDLALGPALALGASESTLLEMTGAYAGILNGGSAVEPYGLSTSRCRARRPVMGVGGGIRERVIQEAAARQLAWMMWRVVEDGTGQRARIPGWAGRRQSRAPPRPRATPGSSASRPTT
jgi:membrane peptidoglycan carboxypeptidase